MEHKQTLCVGFLISLYLLFNWSWIVSNFVCGERLLNSAIISSIQIILGNHISLWYSATSWCCEIEVWSTTGSYLFICAHILRLIRALNFLSGWISYVKITALHHLTPYLLAATIKLSSLRSILLFSKLKSSWTVSLKRVCRLHLTLSCQVLSARLINKQVFHTGIQFWLANSILESMLLLRFGDFTGL